MTVDVYAVLNINSATGTPVENFQAIVTAPIGTNRRHPVMTDAVYYHASSGTYSYDFVAHVSVLSGTALALNMTLTAIYLPTSYAAVMAMVSEPGDFPNSEPIEVYDINGNPTGETKYKVDLRHLELKAKEARIKALEAELELQKARKNTRRD